MGSIPVGATDIFNLYNLSGRTMTFESTETLRYVCTRNISWVKRPPVPKVDKLLLPIVSKSGIFKLPEPGPVIGLQRD